MNILISDLGLTTGNPLPVEGGLLPIWIVGGLACLQGEGAAKVPPRRRARPAGAVLRQEGWRRPLWRVRLKDDLNTVLTRK